MAQRARGSRETLFFISLFLYFFIFLIFLNSIQFRMFIYIVEFNLRFLKTPASAAHATTATGSARVHCQVNFQVVHPSLTKPGSGPPAVSRSDRACRCAIVRTIRTRMNSHEHLALHMPVGFPGLLSCHTRWRGMPLAPPAWGLASYAPRQLEP